MYFKKQYIGILLALLVFVLAACSSEGSNSESNGDPNDPTNVGNGETLVFADPNWDSIRFHNSVVQFIVENGLGYETDIMAGSTPATLQGLQNNDIQIYMEIWKENVIDSYQQILDSGEVVEVGTNFADSVQGLYVPTYVIEGDPERGIEPMAPDLKTVEDLKKYPEIFPDPEDPSKGRIIGAIPGWAVDQTISDKIESYGLDEYYNLFRPGSDSALGTSLVDAYLSGEPWVGYYWEPTWIAGMYDLTLLEEPAYDEEIWNESFLTEFPPVNVVKAVHKEIEEEHPEVFEFVSNYESSNVLTNEALAYMQENEATPDEAAINFLKVHEDIWTAWVPEEVAQKVKDALE